MCLSLHNEVHRLIFELRLKTAFDSCTSTQDHVRYFHFDTKVSSIIHFDIFFLDSYYLRSIHSDTFFTSTYSHRIKSLLRSFHFDSKFHVDRFTSIQKFHVDSFTSTETSFFQKLHFDSFISHRCCTSTYFEVHASPRSAALPNWSSENDPFMAWNLFWQYFW